VRIGGIVGLVQTTKWLGIELDIFVSNVTLTCVLSAVVVIWLLMLLLLLLRW